MDPAKKAAFDRYVEEQAEKQRLAFDRVIIEAQFHDWEIHGIMQVESDMDAKEAEEAQSDEQG